ncbi:Ger(x)C family spore germination protein [Paenibacillus albus]|uniref:Ger(X)C family spore germination protein n=1 Tax=Paenibacillus albus TaxID=2495582 RepID=A0A3S9A9J3_9BACL|nr:Ger(x)C family spore germination protein [Paenibacillus albus]AZN42374.1 Ger(x)C family spore germination protein [Paenibacillus albus]
MRKKPVLLPLCILLLLQGCAEQRRLEGLGIVTTAALDLNDAADDPDAKALKVAVAIKLTEAKSGPQERVIQTTDNSPKEARNKLSRQTSQILVSGQLQNLIIGEKLAKRGIYDYLDSYRRDYTVSERMRIIVSKGSSIELLSHQYKDIPEIGDYLSTLLVQEEKINESPSSSMHEFIRDYLDDGVDPIGSIIEQKNDLVEADGIALFKGAQYVGAIAAEKSTLFMMLKQSFQVGGVIIRMKDNPSGKKQSAVLSALINKRKVTVEDVGSLTSAPKVGIEINLDSILLEYMGDKKLNSVADREQLTKELTEAIREELEGIMKRLQQLGTDSVGIGTAVRNKMSYGAWKKTNWEQVYPKTEIKVNVKLHVRDYGMIES